MPRAAVLKDDAFRVVEVTPRVLGPGEVRVRVASAGVNFWEVMQKQGRVPRPADGVLGTEGVGVVVETAPDVVDAKTGTRVAWFKVPGSFADEVVVGSYCTGAVHMALSWVTSEALRVTAEGEVEDLTVRSLGILRAVDMPPVQITVERVDAPAPLAVSDAVFAATAAAVWQAQDWAPSWPTQRPVR